MAVPDDATLLRTWETGHGQPPLQRPLTLLAAVRPESDPAALARLPLGQRDAGLLTLRESLFGPRLDALVECPACGEPLEFAIDLAALQAAAESGAPQPQPQWLEQEGYRLRFRVPTTEDLLRVAAQGGPGLLGVCLLAAERDGEPVTPEALPAGVQQAVMAAMAAADPGAELRLTLDCPACRHRWEEALDVAGYLWRELDTWARRTLGEVHLLARAYGWSETEILALGPARRRLYLEMVQA